MFRTSVAATLLAVSSLAVSAPAMAEEEAATPTKMSVAETSIGALLDDPAAKAILDKYLAGFSTNPQVDMARGMTLKAVQGFAPDQITDDALAKIDADLAALGK